MKPETIELMNQNRDRFSADTQRLLDAFLEGRQAMDEDLSKEEPQMIPSDTPVPVQGITPQVSQEAPAETPDYGRLMDQVKDPLEEYIQKGGDSAPPTSPPVDTPAPQKRDPALDAETYMARLEQVESSGNPNAVSPKGAVGLTQITPPAMRDVLRARGEDDSQYSDEQLRQMALNPEINRSIGKEYLQMMLDKYKDPQLALAAYNAGPGAVDKHGGIPPYKETQDYVEKNLGPLAGLKQSFDQQREANVLKAKSEIEAAEIDSAKLTELERIEQERIAVQVQQQQRQESLLKEAEARRQALQQELQNTSIDSERWWTQKSTGQKILTVVGTVMMALVNPLAAVGMINNAINSDIELQKKELEFKRKKLDDLNTVYGQALKATGDAELATLEAKAAAIQKVRDHLKLKATQTGKQAVIARATETDGKLQEEQAKYLLDAEQKILSNDKLRAETAQMNPERQLLLQKAAAGGDEQAISLLPEKDRARVVRDTEGKVVGMARTPEDAQKITEAQAVKSDFQALLDRLVTLRSESPVPINPATLKEGRDVASQLRIKLKDLAALGALSGSDMQLIEATVPANPFGIEQWGLAERLKKMKADTEAAYQRKLNSRMQDFSPARMGRKVGVNVAPRGQ